MGEQSASGKQGGRLPPRGEHASLLGASELLSARQYDRVERLLLEQQEAAQRSGQMAIVIILAAASQLCLTCKQFQADRELHELGYEEAARRERESRHQIRTVLAMLSQLATLESQEGVKTAADLAAVRGEIAEPAETKSDEKPTLMRKIRQLLGIEPSPTSDESPIDAEREFEETMVSAPDEIYRSSTLSDLAHEAEMPDEGLTSPDDELSSLQSRQEQTADARADVGLEAVRESGAPPPAASPETSPVRSREAGPYEELSTPSLVVYCLGPFQAYLNERAIVKWPSGKGKAIFKYLVTNRQRPVAKEVLMDLFWPEADPDAARNNLNVAIYGLRQAFRNGDDEFSHVLYKNECYLLNPALRVWLDVDEFRQLLGTAQKLQQQGNMKAAIRLYDACEALYRGEFLAEDRYEEWAIPDRRSLQDDYLRLLEQLSRYYLEQEAYATCIITCEKMLAIEPCREDAHRQLMRAYSRQEQRYLALRQYHACRDALERELGVEPGRRTVELYEKIRHREPI